MHKEEVFFMAKVIQLADCKKIQVNIKQRCYSFDEIDEQIYQFLKENAPYVQKKTPVEIGDHIIVSMQGYENGIKIEELKSEYFQIVVGSKSFLDGFSEQMIGMKLNESRDVYISLPMDCRILNLAGKEIMFRVVLEDNLYQKEVEISDEFVQSLHLFGITTLEELRQNIITRLEKEAYEECLENASEQVRHTLLTNSIVELSEDEILCEIEKELKYTKQQFSKAGISFQEILNLYQVDEETYKKGLRKSVIEELKLDLILKEIAFQEQLNVDEIEAWIHQHIIFSFE